MAGAQQGQALAVRPHNRGRQLVNAAAGLRVAQIKKDILDSNLCEQYMLMIQTKREVMVNQETGELELGQELETADWLKICTTVFNKVIPNAKDVEEQSTANLADWVKDLPAEQKKTP